MYRSVYKTSILFLILSSSLGVSMSKPKYIVYLRDEMGLSFWQIAKIVYPDEFKKKPEKTELKVYGIYVKEKGRYMETKDKSILISTGICQAIDHYVKTKIHESHEPLFVGDLKKKRLELARQLKYSKNSERDKIYREINKIKLLELLIIVYDLIGLSQYDKDRMFLITLYNVGKKLVERIDLSKDHVKWRRSGIDHLSEYAAAFLYIVYFVVLYNTQYQGFLEKVRGIIYTIMKGRSRKKKIERIQKIIQEKYGDVIPRIILRIS